MQVCVSFLVCAFLTVIVASDNSPGRSPCTVDRVCGVLETILQRQDRLEKTVKEHSKILSGERCTEGKIGVVDFIISSVPNDRTSQLESWGKIIRGTAN